MQEELSKHGLNDPGATHKALDIELGQVHKQVAKLDLELQALKDNPMLAPATAETLDKLGSAAFTELPATTKQVQTLEAAQQDLVARMDSLQRTLHLFSQQLKQQQQQQQGTSGTAYLVAHAPQGTTPNAIQQAVSLAAGCNVTAVMAVLPFGKGNKKATAAAAPSSPTPTTTATAAVAAATATTSTTATAANNTAAAGSTAAAKPGRCSFLVKVAAQQVSERALRGKHKLRQQEACKHIYLEPKRSQEQQRHYKQLYPLTQGLRQRKIRFRWQRDSHGVETGLQQQQRDGTWVDAAPLAPSKPTTAPAAATAAAAPATADNPTQQQPAADQSRSAPRSPRPRRRSAGGTASQRRSSRSSSKAAPQARGSRRCSPSPEPQQQGRQQQRQQQQQQQQQDATQARDQDNGEKTKKKQKKEKRGETVVEGGST